MIEREGSAIGLPPSWEFPQEDYQKLGFIQDRVREELSEMHSMGYDPREIGNFQFVIADTIYRCSELLGVPGPLLKVGSGRTGNGQNYDALSSWLSDETHVIEISNTYIGNVLAGLWKPRPRRRIQALKEFVFDGVIRYTDMFPQAFLTMHPARIISHEIHHNWNRIINPQQSFEDGHVFATGINNLWEQTPSEKGAVEFSRSYVVNYLSKIGKLRKKIYLDLMLK